MPGGRRPAEKGRLPAFGVRAQPSRRVCFGNGPPEVLGEHWLTLSLWSPLRHERTPLLSIDPTDFLGFRGDWDRGSGVVRWKKEEAGGSSVLGLRRPVS